MSAPDRITTKAHSPESHTVDQSDASHTNSMMVVESSKLVPLIVVLAAIAGIAVAISISAYVQSSVAEREARMLQYYVLEMDAKLIAAGVKKGDDSVAGKLKEK